MRHTKIFTSILGLACCLVASAYSPSYYTQQSKLSTGRWIKIKVSQSGMQQITAEQLRAWGFNDPSKVSVFGYGGCILTGEFSETHYDDLPAQPVYRTNDGRILFYGESDVAFRNSTVNPKTPVIRRNTAASAGYYFVTDAFPGASKFPDTIGNTSNTGRLVNYHYSIHTYEEEVLNPGEGGYRYFGTDFSEKPVQQFDFKVVNPYSENGVYKDGRITFVWAAKLQSSAKLGLDYNGTFVPKNTSNPLIPVPTSNHLYYNTATGYVTFSPIQKEEKDYSIVFSTPTVKYTMAAFDYVSMIYQRDNDLSDIDQLLMSFEYVNSNTRINFTNVASGDVQLWNVCVPTHPQRYDRTYSSENKSMRIGSEKDYNGELNYVMAFDPNKQMYPVEFAGEVKNQNLHGLAAPDMLIITSRMFLAQAQELAAIHKRLQNLDVVVVNQEEVYNEFSSGTPSMMGYRRIAKMFYDQNPNKFKYLLLYGPGSYDNRHLKFGDDSYLLTYQCEDDSFAQQSTTNFSFDNYFGFVADDFKLSEKFNAPAQVAVGRIPAFNIDDAIRVNKKIADYLENPPLNISRRTSIILADGGDSNSHLSQAEEIDSIIRDVPGTIVTKSYVDLYPFELGVNTPQEVLVRALNKGAFFMGYCGHGDPISITGKGLYNKAAVKENTYPIKPLVFLSTCDAMTYDRNGNGLGESFLIQPDGGAIGVVAACRTVYQELNQLFYRSFVQYLLNATPGTRMGDIYLKASNLARSSKNQGESFNVNSTEAANTMCYNFAGDPSLPIYTPQYNVMATDISGTTISDGTTLNISPLTDNTVTGAVTDASGNIISDFNGTLSIYLYDAAKETMTLGQGTYTPTSVTIDNECLSTVSTTVTNGRFSTSLVVPESTNPGKESRLVFYAVSDDILTQASGEFKGIIIGDYDETKAIPDNIAPMITSFYLDYPGFQDGDVVACDSRLHVSIAPDESGLYIGGPQIGRKATLVLDGNVSYPRAAEMMTTAADGSYILEYDLTGLSAGPHHLQFSVSDNSNNVTSRSISFTVADLAVDAVMTVAESPARIEATISVEGDFATAPTGRIVIEDAAGVTIFSTDKPVSFPYTWDLKDKDGQPVPDGRYDCFAILSGGRQTGSTPRTKLIVVKQ
ncbi:MAG: type IX secretion system sortase PorU [Pseudoflavonifractor sp.]|nr:type IX secretion system sortase PorU [Pseudoflavonifractor sp.]